MYNYILTPNKLTIVGNQKHIQIESDNQHWEECRQLLKEKKFEEIIQLVDKKDIIIEYMNGNISIIDDCVLIDGKQIHNRIVDRIIQFKNEGYDFVPLINFIKNQLLNPSSESIEDLYDFIEHGSMPITSDGCFLAYKVVDSDYLDKHSNTFDNHIGCVCEMNREDVDSDRLNTCSTGLHVCTYDYISSFICCNDHVMIVKVNPKDVVSVPVDYNQSKMRCCKYVVVDEYINFNKGTSGYFNKLYYDNYEEDSTEITEGKIFTLNKYLNNSLRKNKRIEIIKVNVNNNSVCVKKVNGHTIYSIELEKLLKCIE